MSPAQPTIVMVCDALRMPPRLGFELHMVQLAAALARHARVVVVARARGGTAVLELPDGVHWSLLDAASGIGAKLQYRAAVLRLVRDEEEVSSGSLLWVRSVSTAALLAPALAGLRGSGRGIRTLYDAASFHRLEARSGLHAIRDTMLGALEERLWRGFDLVRTLGPAMRDYLVERGVAAEKIRMVPVGCEDLPAVRTGARTGNQVLYVGSERPWQGLPALLGAMRALHERGSLLQLTVAGPTGGEEAPNVRFLGRVPPDAAKELYAGHELLVVPRVSRPLTRIVLPMKVVEALAYGIPILATDLPAIRDAVGPEAGRFLADARPVPLADAMEELIGDPDRLASMSRAAFARAQAFRWSRIAETAVGELL